MIYVRSFLAGLATLIALCVVIVGAAILAPAVMERLPFPSGGGIIFFSTWTIITGVGLIVLASAVVSCWTFKRAHRTSRLRS